VTDHIDGHLAAPLDLAVLLRWRISRPGSSTAFSRRSRVKHWPTPESGCPAETVRPLWYEDEAEFRGANVTEARIGRGLSGLVALEIRVNP